MHVAQGLLARAAAIAPRFRCRNLREFVLRRAAERIRRATALGAAAQSDELEKVTQLLNVSERQIPLQNAYFGESNVLEND